MTHSYYSFYLVISHVAVLPSMVDTMSVLRFKSKPKGKFCGISYQLSTGPWFGPTKRGRDLLLASSRHGDEVNPDDFIKYLKAELPKAARGIERIQFVRYRERRSDPPWPLRFAVCNTSANYDARKRLYLSAAKIVEATGWYPLVTGSRVRDRRKIPVPKIRRIGTLWDIFSSNRLGEIVNVRGIVPGQEGSSILVQCEHGEILLDFGFRCNLLPNSKFRIGFLTHRHEDHAGGISGAIDAGLPIVLNESIYRQLLDDNRLSEAERACCFPVTAPCTFFTEDRAEIKLIPGAHSPGAAMVRITTPRGDQLLYPGDYCLANAYYQLPPSDLLRHFSKIARNRTLLVDGTFLGYDLKARNTSLFELKKALALMTRSGRTVVFLSKTAEYLYPLYIWMFRTFYSSGGGHERSLIVDKKLQLLLDSTFGEIFLRHRQIDPFVTSILKKAESNYVESVRLYHLQNGQVPLSLPPPVDIFCTADHVQRLLLNLPGDAAFFVVGRRDPKIDRLLAGPLLGKDVQALDGADFSFHSRPEHVAQIVLTAAGNGIRPIVFHNYPDKIVTALDHFGVRRDSYEPLHA
jgi:hypothetical protein